MYNLEISGDYKLENDNTFWIQNGTAFQLFNSLKDARKLFPDQAQQIKQFTKDTPVKFDKQDDVIRLLRFLNHEN